MSLSRVHEFVKTSSRVLHNKKGLKSTGLEYETHR